ncbi:sulfotransferase family 2 domain-containing protein [Fulvivirgaceae bacterium PWU4]|uniref:Sulfotransferase family 2 domain-containing protein n=1 Tax=Chryseosolibacter histidini TaxID=2782349 RepID=A0AAP2DFE7_9BACT|nr:sulfotransferase family 2 domain-containing protein [Chryseosolibacter histidini]MBT1695493.1 sulfotransferase family 2 domain-containing protein [Chryseosolibacter histidini]
MKFRNPSVTSENWRRNTRHQFAADFAQEIYASNSIYSHIPKNASSTMRYSVALANRLITPSTDISWVYANNMTFVPSLRFQTLADYTFVILRCPFSRLASAFLDQIVRRPHMYVMRQRKKGFNRHIVDKIVARHITFERFVLKLRDNPGFLRLNAHWRPQVDFLLYEEYDDYFCVENMGSATKILKEKIDLDVVDTRHLAKHGIDRYKKVVVENGFQLTAPQIQKMKHANTIVDPQCLYSAQLVKMVANLYAQDIDLYWDKFGGENLLFKVR